MPQPQLVVNRDDRARRQLGQLRPGDTTAASVYTPGTGVIGTVTAIVVSNTTSSSRVYRIFHDANGTTFDATTSLFFDVTIGANATVTISDDEGWGVEQTGNIGVRTDFASALTFTAYGYEISLAPT